jgi:hypothetical protein
VKRVSPSMAVALLALFVALGGTGYAAAKLNGRNIVNRSISGSKLKRNTLGGGQIRESSLGRVPNAADSDFLDGRPASAYLLAGTGVAANALRLGGKDASAFLPVGATAANAALLGGSPASAFLPAGGTAANSNLLGGRPASDFVPAGRLTAPAPQIVPMPATPGAVTRTTLVTDGPLSLVAECENSGGTAVARIGIRNDVEFFLLKGEADNAGAGIQPVFVPPTTQPIAQVTAGGIKQSRHNFSAIATNGAAAIQGTATAIADGPPDTAACYLAAWAFVS